MKFYIDTNTFPTNPALYADAEKSKRIPQILPVVQLTRGVVQIGFLGENPPPDGALVEFSATIAGTNTQVVLARGEKTANGDAWEFNLNFNSEALSIALESKHADVMLIAGIIVSTDAFRQEWQLRLSASETATGELDPKQVESAKDFADVAERSATRAEEAAQHAEQSARNASESAEAAQASAEAAKKSQEAAAQSAKEALQSKNDAVSAKNAAETAKTDAEKAKTAAEAAKTGAERARDDANKILRNVESEAESVKASGEQALSEIESAKQEAKAEIGAFTDVYTKAETYSKSQIDGVATGAEVTAAMNQAAEQLLALRGEIPDNFYEMLLSLLEGWSQVPTATWQACWAEMMEAVRLWRENPTEKVLFGATDKPYEPKNGVVVDFRQIRRSQFVETNLGNATGYSMFASAFSGVVVLTTDEVPQLLMNSGGGSVSLYAPNTTELNFAFTRRYASPGQGVYRVYAPSAVSTHYAFYVNYNAKEVYVDFRSSTVGYGVFSACTNLTKVEGRFDSYRVFDPSFCSGDKKLTHARIYAPSLCSASGAFANSGLDAESICYTLDNLSADPVGRGGNGIITFTGCPGASELTQESPSVAAAVARGWTVEL